MYSFGGYKHTDTIWPKSTIWGPDLGTKMAVYYAFELKSRSGWRTLMTYNERLRPNRLGSLGKVAPAAQL